MEIRAKTRKDQQILQAAANGYIDILRGLSNHILRTTVCTSGCTCLHWAAGCSQVAVLSYLVLERGIPVDLKAVKKARDRTPLHYACRNGYLDSAKWLVEMGGADPDARAKHGVSPFQLAVWQNRLQICQWLVQDCGVDPAQVNDFACGAVHWIGLCPSKGDGADLLPFAKWLATQPGVNFRLKQRQGHSPLHKAAWGGHLELIKYLHQYQDLWDDSQDDAGNYAADLADMANTPRHSEIARYLRHHCSRARAESCAILRVPIRATESDIRKAYLQQARELHPDRQIDMTSRMPRNSIPDHEFDALHKAYHHLVDAGGRGNQSNPAHSLNLMLEHVNAAAQDSGKNHTDRDDVSLFKARLIAVLLEYGERGLDLSNVKKKWKQVWPDEPFPDYSAEEVTGKTSKKTTLSEFLQVQAGDVVEFVKDGSGMTRLLPKHTMSLHQSQTK